MRSTAAMFVLIGLVAVPVQAQGNGAGRNGAQGIPPGHLPPPGECRVWYDGRPPGHQPPSTSCREAERVASRDRNARVIYGAEPNSRSSRDPIGPGRDGHQRVAFDSGYKDGYEKGQEDGRGTNSYDPVRHSRYRSGDRGYNRRYGSKEEYKLVYREGFEAGYGAGYREANGGRDRRRSRPFDVPTLER